MAEAELRVIEAEKRIERQRAIVTRLERMDADTEQARKLLSCLVDAQQEQQRQLERLRGRIDGKP